MKRLQALRGYLAKHVNWLLALLLIMVLAQPDASYRNGRVVITLGPPEAYAAGTADYSLDGLADDVEVQSALNALPNQGGLLHFKAGTYNLTANVTRAIGNVTIEGEGRNTLFTGSGSFVAGGNQWVFRDMALNATTQVDMVSTTGWKWFNVYDSVTFWTVRDSANGQSILATVNATTIFITSGNITSANISSLNMSGDILPTSNNTRSLGTTLLRWLTGWFVNLVSETHNTTQLNATTANITTGYITSVNATSINASGTILSNTANFTNINMTGNITPTVNTTHNLGSTLLRWLNGWFTNLFVGTANITTLNAPTGRGATLTVASVNATAQVRAQADYVLTGVNDEVTIQTAVNALTAGRMWNETVKIIGTAVMADWVQLASYTNIDLTEGRLELASGNIGLYASSRSYISIYGGTIDGNNVSSYAIAFDGNSQYISVKGVQIISPNNQAILINATGVFNHVYIDSNDIISPAGSGINVVGTAICDNLFITNNKVSGMHDTNQAFGIWVAGAGWDTATKYIAGNTVLPNGTNVTGGDHFGVRGINGQLVNNTAFGAYADGFAFGDAGVVTANWKILGNIGGNGTAAGQGLMLSNATNMTIVGNTFNNNTQAGIAETAGCDFNIIVGNIVQNNGTVGIVRIGQSSIIRGNIGYITENSGNVTMLLNTNTISVTHGLAATPTWVQFSSTSNETGWLRVVSVGATTFNISSSYNVTANTTIYWRATIGAGN